MIDEPRKETLGDVSHSIRAAQAILQYGVGAMVDFPDQTLMTAAPEYWGSTNHLRTIRDERLEHHLGVDFFAIPRDKSEPREQGIAYTRFPRWYFCPKCRRLEPLSFWLKEFRLKGGSLAKRDRYMTRPICVGDKCRSKRGRGIGLVPARIIVACEGGHIDDFPWVEWVHFVGKKPICGDPHLVFKTGASSSSGLEGLTVGCETCGAKATLVHSFDLDGLARIPGYHCTGNMPWRKETVDCDRIPQAKQRGASVVYYPKVDSSIVIPPYSNRVRSRVVNSAKYAEILSVVRDNDKYGGVSRDAFIALRLNDWLDELASALHTDREAIKLHLTALLEQTDPDQRTHAASEIYRQDEYRALAGMIDTSSDDADFVREGRNGKDYCIPGVSHVSLLHKIREVRALVGFTRLNPSSTGTLGIPEPDRSRFQCVKKPQTRWYPGYEVRGEGIFIQFNDKILSKWFQANRHAEAQMRRLRNNATTYGLVGTKIDAKFVFLHTLAHLLIQRLSFESGYNSASLRERIYCDLDHHEFPMSGLFIYTACGDSEGTLGGLVRQGTPDRLRSVFLSALQGAQWCSNDPICGESGGQGRHAMNLAACHACSLLPETSCEEFNVLLDRTLLIGRITERSVGFFSSWLDDTNRGRTIHGL